MTTNIIRKQQSATNSSVNSNNMRS